MYPDQSLYACDSVHGSPALTTPSSALTKSSGAVASTPATGFVDHFLPIVADAEAGFGGVLNAFELMKEHDHPQVPLAFTSKTNWLPEVQPTWVARCWCLRKKKPLKS